MSYKVTYRRFCILLGTLFFSTFGSYALAAGTHYLRGVASVGYVHEMGGQTPEISSVSEAQELIRSGQIERLEKSNGVGTGIGIGYRYAYKHLLIDVGLGCDYRYRVNQLTDISDIEQPAVDEEGYDYMGLHTWSGRQNTWQNVGLNIPIMIGGEWNSVYFLVGAKLNVNVWGRTQEKGKYSLAADYDRYMDPFSGMSNHGYVTDEPYACAPTACSFSWDVRACAEVGYCLSGPASYSRTRSVSPRYYLGAYAEYGIAPNNKIYNSLEVGAKLTILLPIKAKEACMCLSE